MIVGVTLFGAGGGMYLRYKGVTERSDEGRFIGISAVTGVDGLALLTVSGRDYLLAHSYVLALAFATAKRKSDC